MTSGWRRCASTALNASKARALLDGFAEATSRSVADFQAKADPAAIDKAVEILAGAETIYLAGLRRSFPITSYMAYAMGKLGIRNLLVDGLAGLGAEQTSFISGKDALLAISFTPYASETVALAACRQGQGRQDRLDHRFGVLPHRADRRCVARGGGGQFRGLPLDGRHHGAGDDAHRGGGGPAGREGVGLNQRLPHPLLQVQTSRPRDRRCAASGDSPGPGGCRWLGAHLSRLREERIFAILAQPGRS